MRNATWLEQRLASISGVWASFLERQGVSVNGRGTHGAAPGADNPIYHQGKEAAADYGHTAGAAGYQAGAAAGKQAGSEACNNGWSAGSTQSGLGAGGAGCADACGTGSRALDAGALGTAELEAALIRPSFAFAEDGWVRFEVLNDQQLIDSCQGETGVLLRSFSGNPEERALLLMPLIRMLVRQCGPLPAELSRFAPQRADMLRRSLKLAAVALDLYGSLATTAVKSSTILKSITASVMQNHGQDGPEESAGEDETAEGRTSGAKRTRAVANAKDNAVQDGTEAGAAAAAAAAMAAAADDGQQGGGRGAAGQGRAGSAAQAGGTGRLWRYFAAGRADKADSSKSRHFKDYMPSQPGFISGPMAQSDYFARHWSADALNLYGGEYDDESDSPYFQSSWTRIWNRAGSELNSVHHEINDLISLLHGNELPGQISAEVLARQASGLDPQAASLFKARHSAGGSRKDSDSAHSWQELQPQWQQQLSRTLWGTGTGSTCAHVEATAWGKELTQANAAATGLHNDKGMAACGQDSGAVGCAAAAAYCGAAYGAAGAAALPRLDRMGKGHKPFCGDSLDLRHLATSRVLGPLPGMICSDDEWTDYLSDLTERCHSNALVRAAGISELAVNRDHNSDGTLMAFKKEHFGPLCQSLYHQAQGNNMGRYDSAQLDVIVQLSLIMVCFAHQLWRCQYEYEIRADNGRRYDPRRGTVSLSQFCEDEGARWLYVRYAPHCERLTSWTADYYACLSERTWHDSTLVPGLDIFSHFCPQSAAVVSQIFPISNITSGGHPLALLSAGLSDFLDTVDQSMWEPLHAPYLIQYLLREQLASGWMLRSQLTHDLRRLQALALACGHDLNAPPSPAAAAHQYSRLSELARSFDASAAVPAAPSADADDAQAADIADALAADGIAAAAADDASADNATADDEPSSEGADGPGAPEFDPDDPESAWAMSADDMDMVLPDEIAAQMTAAASEDDADQTADTADAETEPAQSAAACADPELDGSASADADSDGDSPEDLDSDIYCDSGEDMLESMGYGSDSESASSDSAEGSDDCDFIDPESLLGATEGTVGAGAALDDLNSEASDEADSAAAGAAGGSDSASGDATAAAAVAAQNEESPCATADRLANALIECLPVPELTDEIRLELQLRELHDIVNTALRRISINRSDSDIYACGNYVFLAEHSRAWAVLNKSWQEYIYGPLSDQSESNLHALGLEIMQSFMSDSASEKSALLPGTQVLVRTGNDMVILMGNYLCCRELDMGTQVQMEEFVDEELEWQLRLTISLYLLAQARAQYGQDPATVDLGPESLNTAVYHGHDEDSEDEVPLFSEQADSGMAIHKVRDTAACTSYCAGTADLGQYVDGSGAGQPGPYQGKAALHKGAVYSLHGSGLSWDEEDDSMYGDDGLHLSKDPDVYEFYDSDVLREMPRGRGFDWRRVSLHGFGEKGPRARVRASTRVKALMEGRGVIKELFGRVVLKNAAQLSFMAGDDLSAVDIEVHAMPDDPFFTAFAYERNKLREYQGRNAIANAMSQARSALDLSHAVEKEYSKAVRHACSDDFLRNSLDDMLTREQIESNSPEGRKAAKEAMAAKEAKPAMTAKKSKAAADSSAPSDATQTKGRRGRRKKSESEAPDTVQADEVTPKRRRGRPRNVVAEAIAESQNEVTADGTAVSAEAHAAEEKPRRGRPRKVVAEAMSESQNEVTADGTAVSAEAHAAEEKPRRGRRRKVDVEAMSESQNEVTADGTDVSAEAHAAEEKPRRGRPRKVVAEAMAESQNEGAAAGSAVSAEARAAEEKPRRCRRRKVDVEAMAESQNEGAAAGSAVSAEARAAEEKPRRGRPRKVVAEAMAESQNEGAAAGSAVSAEARAAEGMARRCRRRKVDVEAMAESQNEVTADGTAVSAEAHAAEEKPRRGRPRKVAADAKADVITAGDNTSTVDSTEAAADAEYELIRRECRRNAGKAMASEMLKKAERHAAIEEAEYRLEKLDPEYAERRALSRILSRPNVTLEELEAAERRFGSGSEELGCDDWDDCGQS